MTKESSREDSDREGRYTMVDHSHSQDVSRIVKRIALLASAKYAKSTLIIGCVIACRLNVIRQNIPFRNIEEDT